MQERRRKLQDSIDEFCKLAQLYLPARARESRTRTSVPDEWVDIDQGQSFDDEESDSDDQAGKANNRRVVSDVVSALPAEEQTIPLPSRFGSDACRTYLKPLAEIELALRRAQANDALHNLRLEIAQKSFLYRRKIRRSATNANHKRRLRSRADVVAVSSSIDLWSKIYMSAHSTMKTLGASTDTLHKYQVLQPKDVQTSTAVVDFNAPGQRNRTLSWIWHSRDSSTKDPLWMEECRNNNYIFISFTTDIHPSVSGKLATRKK